MKRISVVLICTTLLLSSCGLLRPRTITTQPKQSSAKANFVDCAGFKCANISVPMNYSRPNGRKISLSLIKIPASKPQEKLGVLLINPGGPGSSGVDFLRDSASYLFDRSILDRFDIISWDPRGVGKSSKVDCASDIDYLFNDIDYSPDNDKELEDLKRVNKQFSTDCAKVDKQLLKYLSTDDTVKDLDEIRKQLGEKTINYLGFSYGTAIGQLYAHNYPKNIRSMVLDGVVDMGAKPHDVMLEQAVGFDNSLDSFFDYCKKNSCKYSKSSDPKEVFMQLMDSVNKTAIPSTVSNTLSLGPAQFDLGVAYYLYGGEIGWQQLDLALAQALAKNPEMILNGFSNYTGRNTNGIYDGTYGSFLQIGCADGAIGDVDEYVRFAKEVGKRAPVFGESGVYLGLTCATWSDKTIAKPVDVNAKGSVPIIVIGTTGDPATPVQWARNATEQLQTGVYVEFVGEGHTAYGQGNSCIDDIVNNYLISVEKPKQTQCN